MGLGCWRLLSELQTTGTWQPGDFCPCKDRKAEAMCGNPPGAASVCFAACPDVCFGVIMMSSQEGQRLESSEGFCLQKRARRVYLMLG